MKFRDSQSPLAPSGAGRRRFVQGLAFGGVAAGLGLARLPAFAAQSAAHESRSLAGRHFELEVGEMPVTSPAPRVVRRW